MQIHVVRPGENIFEIARQYNTSTAAIISSNELDEPGLSRWASISIPIDGQFISFNRDSVCNRKTV